MEDACQHRRTCIIERDLGMGQYLFTCRAISRGWTSIEQFSVILVLINFGPMSIFDCKLNRLNLES